MTVLGVVVGGRRPGRPQRLPDRASGFGCSSTRATRPCPGCSRTSTPPRGRGTGQPRASRSLRGSQSAAAARALREDPRRRCPYTRLPGALDAILALDHEMLTSAATLRPAYLRRPGSADDRPFVVDVRCCRTSYQRRFRINRVRRPPLYGDCGPIRGRRARHEADALIAEATYVDEVSDPSSSAGSAPPRRRLAERTQRPRRLMLTPSVARHRLERGDPRRPRALPGTAQRRRARPPSSRSSRRSPTSAGRLTKCGGTDACPACLPGQRRPGSAPRSARRSRPAQGGPQVGLGPRRTGRCAAGRRR